MLFNKDKLKIEFIQSLSQISNDDWQKLNSSSSPFLQYDFFNVLEKSHCAHSSQGWQPNHLIISTNNNAQQNDVVKGTELAQLSDTIEAIMPMYLKSHSWGEYVFDWSWADAYKRNGLTYYPKLVATIPFTPVSSSKLITNSLNYPQIFKLMIDYCQQQSIGSWHVLYCPQLCLTDPIVEYPDDVYQRNTVQFHWFNRGFHTFEQFLQTFTSRKRKNTKKERLTIAQQGIEIRTVLGKAITTQELDYFYLTYQLTYIRRGHSPHLSYDFFKQILVTMADNILLIIASHQQKDIACAWFFFDDAQLYGRYWGYSEYFNNLHFELCYYQGIEFCIKNNLQAFNPGTQGEHKIQRGFEPVLTYSYHWINHPAFKTAIKAFCQQEQIQMQKYLLQCQQALPFKVN